MNVLLKDDYINREIYVLCLELREIYLQLEETRQCIPWTSSELKTNHIWLELMKLADLIKNKIYNYKK